MTRRLLVATVVLAAACGGGSSGTRASSPTPATTPTSAPPGTVVQPAATGNPTSTWPTYHANSSRSGDAGATVPALTGALHVAWSARLDGAVYAEPILVGSTVVVATENDTVYALSLAGRVLWHTHLGTPVPLSALPCGNINPLGITGTPAYDVATGSVFAVAETTGAAHTLYALNGVTGAARWHRSLDVQTRRTRSAQQQRAAALVVSGRVLVAFGGLYGDCGNYVGYVTSVPTSGSGSTTVYTVPTAREGGSWAPPGPVLGPSGRVYVATGNGAATSGSWDGSDSVVALSPTTMARLASFAPSTWPSDNAADNDLGAMGPVPVAGKIVADGKRGIAYLLAATLGGVGHQLASLAGCSAYGGAAFRGTTVFLPCSGGLRALHVGTASLSWGWTAPGISGSPVLAGSVVYALAPDRSTLYELAQSTGHVIASLRLSATVTRLATPTVANGGRLVLVPTKGGVIAIS